MKKLILDKYFGTSLDEWIERTPNELEVDAVGMWQIVPVGMDSFGLSGEGLEDFVRRSVIALINRGAKPVRPSSQKGICWEKQPQYGNFPDEIAENVLSEWISSEEEPNENGLWFALVD